MQTAVVGGTVADRYIAFAFNKVVLQNADPEEAIKQAAKESTMEIQKKIKEFLAILRTYKLTFGGDFKASIKHREAICLPVLY
jgi:hypothetical protein